MKINANLSLCRPIEIDYIMSLVILVLPSIEIMEYIVIWKLEPHDLIRILASSLEDTVSGRLLLVVLEQELVLEAQLWLELERQVRDDAVVLSGGKVMEHSTRGNRYLHRVHQSSILVEQRVVDDCSLYVVPKCHHVASDSVDSWMGGHVVGELTIESVVADTLDVKTTPSIFNHDMEWKVSLEKSQSSVCMVGEGSVCLVGHVLVE